MIVPSTIEAAHQRAGHCLRFVVVKNDRFSAEAIERLIRDEFPAATIVLCHSAADALAQLRSTPADVGVFGLTLPDMDGLDLLNVVVEERLATRRLVVTWRRDERVHALLRQLGIHGTFDSAVEGIKSLAVALRRVVNGQPRFRPAAARPGATGLPDVPLNRLLSDTELQVLAVIGDGSDDQAAAPRLGLSAKTVHTHRQRIMRKLGVQTRAGLMRVALQRGVVRFGADRVLCPGLEHALEERRAQRLRKSQPDG